MDAITTTTLGGTVRLRALKRCLMPSRSGCRGRPGACSTSAAPKALEMVGGATTNQLKLRRHRQASSDPRNGQLRQSYSFGGGAKLMPSSTRDQRVANTGNATVIHMICS